MTPGNTSTWRRLRQERFCEAPVNLPTFTLVTSSCATAHIQDLLQLADHLQVLHLINGLLGVNASGTTIILICETWHSEPYEMPFMKTVQKEMA